MKEVGKPATPETKAAPTNTDMTKTAVPLLNATGLDWVHQEEHQKNRRKMETFNIGNRIKTHRRLKWRQGMTIASHKEERWTRRAAEWNSGVIISMKAHRKIGRPTKRWEDDMNEFVKTDEEDTTQNNDLKKQHLAENCNKLQLLENLNPKWLLKQKKQNNESITTTTTNIPHHWWPGILNSTQLNTAATTLRHPYWKPCWSSAARTCRSIARRTRVEGILRETEERAIHLPGPDLRVWFWRMWLRMSTSVGTHWLCWFCIFSARHPPCCFCDGSLRALWQFYLQGLWAYVCAVFSLMWLGVTHYAEWVSCLVTAVSSHSSPSHWRLIIEPNLFIDITSTVDSESTFYVDSW